MSAFPEVSGVARMIGEPTRAAMLTALLGGEWLTAGELARRARIAPPTASEHLARLGAAGLIVARRAGRHRYYALAGADVAAALESLAQIAAPGPTNALRRLPAEESLRFARSCYDHLAGQLGVLLTEALVERGVLAGAGLDVTPRGEQVLGGLGVDVSSLRGERRPLTRPCLDWSERRDHLAGAVGAALLASLLERGWLARLPGTRAVRLTLRGREGLYRALGVALELPSLAQAR